MAFFRSLCVLGVSLLLHDAAAQLDVCGQAPLNSRIVGGQPVIPGAWPWMVSVYRGDRHICGGSLINNQWVLSAAECFQSGSVGDFRVFLGRQNHSTPSPNEVNRTLLQIINHPSYHRGSIDSDIALLRMASPVNFTNYIRPVCLAASNSTFHTNTSSWVTGWGDIAFLVSLPQPQSLREVDVPIVGIRQCQCDYADLVTITSNMICAGLETGGKGPCHGDAGGPMVSKQSGRWTQSGVTSFGLGCALPNRPAVYARVSQYQAWIQSHITTNQPGFVTFTSPGRDSDLNVSCATVPPLSATPISEVCGQPPLNSRIVGGQPAPPGAWPWQASIHRLESHWCGGSLINSLWVLSAAHCFQSGSLSDYRVYLGRQSQSTSNPNEVSRGLRQVINHANYNPSTQDNDVTLVKMVSPVNFTDYIRPVCLAAFGSTFHTNTSSWVTGWTDIDTRASVPEADRLMEVEVPIVGNRQCQCNYEGLHSITSNMICAGLEQGGKDACQGSGGGPMVSKQRSRWTQSGVVSFGYGCGLPNIPGVYARVSEYQAWINDHLITNQPGFVTFTSPGTDSDLSFNCTTTATTATVVCGRAPLNGNSGGSSVAVGRWPWMASVQKNQTHMCGGTLVSEDAVLSDASCFSSPVNASEWSVVLGQVALSSASSVRMSVANITVSNTSGSNVAVLHLSSKANLSSTIQPICVDTEGTFAEGTTVYSAGWGQQGATGNLVEVQTTIQACPGGSSSDSLCTGVFPVQQGDRGGPLMAQVFGSWVQIVVLANSSSSSRDRASVQEFTKLSRYQSFLKSSLGTLLSPAAATTPAPNSASNSTSSSNSTSNSTSTTASHSAPPAGPSMLCSLLLLSLLSLLLWG